MRALILFCLATASLAETIKWSSSWIGGATSVFHVHAYHALHGWTVVCRFNGPISMFQVWTGKVVSQTGTEVVIKNIPSDGDLAPGEDLIIDFLIRGSFSTAPSAECHVQGNGDGQTTDAGNIIYTATGQAGRRTTPSIGTRTS